MPTDEEMRDLYFRAAFQYVDTDYPETVRRAEGVALHIVTERSSGPGKTIRSWFGILALRVNVHGAIPPCLAQCQLVTGYGSSPATQGNPVC